MRSQARLGQKIKASLRHRNDEAAQCGVNIGTIQSKGNVPGE